MAILDDGLPEPMTDPARYLDVTLAVARDVLVAHRDPAAVELPMFASWGEVKLHRPVLHDDRKAEAERILRELNEGLEHPWPTVWGSAQLLETMIAVPRVLTRDVRNGIHRAYRAAGFDSPDLTEIARQVIRLVSAHRDAIQAGSA
jgi:hypothetical protein